VLRRRFLDGLNIVGCVPEIGVKKVILGDNLEVLAALPSAFASVIYVDPPFNTGKVQKRDRIKATATDGPGGRGGFGGRRYNVERVESSEYVDAFDDFESFLMPRIEASLRCLTEKGSLFVHLDFREVHYIKVAIDRLLGRDRFVNEIIWAYDYGGRPRDRWPPKHDTVFLYARNRGRHVFNRDEVDRIPYMAPGLVGPEKAARGKFPTDVWWHTIVPTNSRERTGYPTQKPLGILRRMVAASSRPGDLVLDFFAGSGTTGQAALELGRRFLLVDENPAAIRTMRKRFRGRDVRFEKAGS
jgi:site-specific DNA-methyltransferase (adenine-specific)